MSDNNTGGFLVQLQASIEQQVKARPFFENVDVVRQDRGDISAQVDEAVGRLGLVVVIEIMKGGTGRGDVGPQALDIDVAVTVIESPLLNRGEGGSGKTCEDCVEELLLLFSPLNSDQVPVYLDKFQVVQDVGGVLAYQLTGTASAGITVAT